MSAGRPWLLIEDDSVDLMAVQRTLRHHGLSPVLRHFWTAEKALEYLHQTAEPLPALILLDLNIPRMSGLDFLAALRADFRLRAIPVIVLSTSGEEADRRQAFALGVVDFLLKAPDYAEFEKIMRRLRDFDGCSAAAGDER